MGYTFRFQEESGGAGTVTVSDPVFFTNPDLPSNPYPEKLIV